jgi:hypothetical protein
MGLRRPPPLRQHQPQPHNYVRRTKKFYQARMLNATIRKPPSGGAQRAVPSAHCDILPHSVVRAVIAIHTNQGIDRTRSAPWFVIYLERGAEHRPRVAQTADVEHHCSQPDRIVVRAAAFYRYTSATRCAHS